jgi:hypothetical protein
MGCVGGSDAPNDTDEEPLPGFSVDPGCGVVSCPSDEQCCLEVFPDASDNETAGYARRDDLIDAFEQTSDRVRAQFTFESPNQRGRVVFNLGRSVSLHQLDIASMAQAPGALSVQIGLSDAVTRGCVFGYDLAALGGGGMQVDEVALTDNPSCYNGGIPGFGSVLDIGVYSEGPGQGVIEISNLALLGPADE